ncbi:MAG TPA: IS3 family transposase [Nitrospira sp.]|nr:IS3 family transposase [Nitrospira sp.]
MIQTLRNEFPRVPVTRMAVLLEVPRSLVYRKPRVREVSPLLDEIQRLAVRFLGYGYRRVHRTLVAEGYEVSEYHVRQVMRDHGLLARRPRSKGCTRSSRKDRRTGNLVKGLTPDAPNHVWVADTTRIRVGSRAMYLAAMLDVYSRKIVGFALGSRNDEALVTRCLQQAILARRPGLGWIHHSDQGSTYLAAGYVGLIRGFGGRLSTSAAGKPTENAFIESFFRTLKFEEVDRNHYQSALEAETAIRLYIESTYNHERMHSSLGYMSPDQFESLALEDKR